MRYVPAQSKEGKRNETISLLWGNRTGMTHLTFRRKSTKMAARSLVPALLSSLAGFALLAMVVVISDKYESTPQLELLQSGGREEMLVALHDKARNYETEAESAADRAYRLESERRAAKERAASLQKEEQHWLQKAQSAREKAEQLRMGRGGGAQADRLQAEKLALKRRLARNEEEMQMVEHMEHQPAPWRGQAAEAPALTSVPHADPKIAKLEEELHHQMKAYQMAREEAQHSDRSRSEANEEMELEKQIAHFRNARESIDTKLQVSSYADSHAIFAGFADRGGVLLQHRGYAPMHEARRRYRSEPKIAHPRRPSGSILGTAEKALGDSAIPASDITKVRSDLPNATQSEKKRAAWCVWRSWFFLRAES